MRLCASAACGAYQQNGFRPIIKSALATRSAPTSAQRHDGAINTVEPGQWTLAAPHEHLLEEKKSKFFAYVWPVASASAARDAISSRSDPRASHNCSAFKIGDSYHFTDDGEPSGTAGRPILTAIEAEGLDGVAVLVVRHFGGTKLGTGVLVRAYGGAARQCLQAAPRQFVVRRAQLQMDVPVAHIGAVSTALGKHAAVRLQEDYGTDGSLRLTVSVAEGTAGALAALVQDRTAGDVTPATPQD